MFSAKICQLVLSKHHCRINVIPVLWGPRLERGS